MATSPDNKTRIVGALIGAAAVIIGGILSGPIAERGFPQSNTRTPEKGTDCPYHGNTDLETFVQIIRAEEKALLEEDISIIEKIYAQEAVMRDVGNNQEWKNVVEKYQSMFTDQDFIRHEHTDFDLLDNTGQHAWVTSGIKGSFVINSTNEVRGYDNPSPSDHFTFGKNNSGCWVLTNVDFNALSETFPP